MKLISGPMITKRVFLPRARPLRIVNFPRFVETRGRPARKLSVLPDCRYSLCRDTTLRLLATLIQLSDPGRMMIFLVDET